MGGIQSSRRGRGARFSSSNCGDLTAKVLARRTWAAVETHEHVCAPLIMLVQEMDCDRASIWLLWPLMKTVNIAELKNGLSRYLIEVRSGQELLIRDRSLAIARIVPIAHDPGQDEELIALAGQGKIRLGEGLLDESFWEMPAPRVTNAALQCAIKAERDDR